MIPTPLLRACRPLLLSWLIAAWLVPAPAGAQQSSPPAATPEGMGQRYALLVGGLGGSEEHDQKFAGYLLEARRALVDRLGFPAEHVLLLSGTAESAAGLSTAENVAAALRGLRGRLTARDELFVVLFGHGSFDGRNAWLNIPRRDLSDEDFAALLDSLPGGRVVFVNTTSASAPFAERLSGPNRVVVTATRTGTQRQETLFPRFFVEALSSPEADLDKNGDLSVRELFAYAAERVEQAFREDQLLATEHALLEDTGDAKPVRLSELETSGEGALAAVTYLRRRDAAARAGASASPELARLYGERDSLEQEIARVKSEKGGLVEDEYYARLETLFVRLARVNDRLENQ